MARKKIYPALFALYVEDMLPEKFTIYGYARSKMSDEEFRDYIGGSLTCRVTDEDSCGDKVDTFLERCYYQPGQYSEQSDFKALSDRMTETEKVRLPLPHMQGPDRLDRLNCGHLSCIKSCQHAHSSQAMCHHCAATKPMHRLWCSCIDREGWLLSAGPFIPAWSQYCAMEMRLSKLDAHA